MKSEQRRRNKECSCGAKLKLQRKTFLCSDCGNKYRGKLITKYNEILPEYKSCGKRKGFKEKQNKKTKTNEEKTTKLKPKQKLVKSKEKKNKNSSANWLGFLGEMYIDHKFRSKDSEFLKKLNLPEKYKNYKWLSHEDPYSKFDFKVNNKFFIEVKTSKKSEPSLLLSKNQIQTIIESSETVIIVNLFNFYKQENIKIFSSKDLLEKGFKQNKKTKKFKPVEE